MPHSAKKMKETAESDLERYNVAQEQISRLNEQLFTAKKTIAAKRKVLDKVSAQKQILQTRWNQQKEARSLESFQITFEREQLNKRIELLEKQLAEKSNVASSDTVKVRQLSQRIQSLAAELEQTRSKSSTEISQLKKLLNSETDQKNEHARQLALKTQAHAEQIHKSEQLSDQVVGLQEELRLTIKELEITKQDVTDSTSKHALLEQKVNQLQSRLQSTETLLSESRQALVNSQQRADSLSQALKGAEKEKQSSDQGLAGLETQVTKLTYENAQLSDKSADTDTRMKVLKEKLALYANKNTRDLADELSITKSELIFAQQEKAQLEKALDTNSQTLRQIEQKLAQSEFNHERTLAALLHTERSCQPISIEARACNTKLQQCQQDSVAFMETQRKTEKKKRVAEQKRVEEEQRVAEQKRVEEEQRVAEQKRVEEEQRVAEQRRVEEEKRVAEQKRVEEEQRAAEQRQIARQKQLEKEEQQLAEQKSFAFVPPTESTSIREIASVVKDSLAAQGIMADFDPQNGTLTLSMDDIVQFENASAILKSSAKRQLKKFFPIYAKALMSQGSKDQPISRVTITGHASPRYRQKFVDPSAHDPEAYRFNLNLSKKRARAIIDFAFGDEIGDYQYKEELKRIALGVGAGYSDPIPAKPGLEVIEACGPFDCGRSRRVEIRFYINDKKLVKEGFKLPDGIQ
jgi:hypothetical protein